MKKGGVQNKSESLYNTSQNMPLNDIDLINVLNSTNARIWTVDKNYCLLFGNSVYHEEFRKTYKREIKNGETVLYAELSEKERIEIAGYYDRAMYGKKFSVEHKRSHSNVKKWNIYHFAPLEDKEEKCIGVSVFAYDITEKRLAKEVLKNSTRRFENLIDVLPEAIFETDTNNKLTYINQRALDLFGYSPEDLTSKLDAMQMLIPEHREIAKQNFAKRLKGADPGPMEYNGLKKDGSIFPILFHASSIIENDEFRGTRGVIVDITKQKRKTEEFKKMALMLDLAPSLIIIHDFEGNILFANKKTFDLHGYSREEFMSLSLKNINSPDSANSITSRLKIIKEKGEASLQVKHIKKDGSELHLEVYALITEWDGNQAILSVGTDITKRKQDEKILSESEEKFKNIFNNSVVGISITSLDGKLNVNKSFSQIIGYSEDELNNYAWQKITHPDDIDKNEEILKSIFKGDIEMARWEKRYIHKNGNIIWVDISTTIQKDDKGKPLYFITSIIDITERKHADEELKSKNTFIEKLIDNSAVSTWISDKNGTAIKMNQACLDFIGATEDEIIGKYNIFNDNVIKENGLMPEIEKVFKKGEVGNFTFDYNFSKVNHVNVSHGKHIIVNSILTPILDDNGIVTNVIVQAVDLSEIKKKEAALKFNETFLTDTQKIANLGTYSMDILSGFWESSEVLDNILGIDENFEKNIEGWLSLIHPEWYDIMRDHLITDVLGKKGNFDKEYKIVRFNDGEERWLHGLGRLEFDESGQPIRMIGTIQDITAIKQVQEALTLAKNLAEKSEAKYKDLFVKMMNASALHEMIFNENGEPVDFKFLEVNPAWEKIVGLKAETVIDKTMREIMPELEDNWFQVYGRVVKTGISEEFEDYNKITKKYYHIYVYRSEPGKFAILFNDITEEKLAAQKLLKAKEKAEESDRLKSAFLANMSHEIRTPMNGILGFSNLLKEPQLTGEEQKRYIEIIEKSGERMLNTINDIIDISKIESGQMEINNSELNIVELLDNTLLFFKPEAGKKEIKLFMANNLSENEIIINSDKEKINAVLTNLVKNAIKFCEKGLIEIGCDRDNDFIKFHVKDTGKGIPEERLEAIFERFVQADIEDRDVKEGSGLGLAIAKSYVELLGGKIWVESKKDVGSTFYFTIPFTCSESQKNKISTHIESAENKIKDLNILIAEDDQVSEFLTKLMIEKISNKILMARTGVEAVELCKKNPDLDLILMDIKMPVMDGYEATRKIREFNKTVVIIATTAFALTGDKEKALETGCTDYLTKPLAQKSLDELLKLYF